jgi:hypothetical protein
MENRYIGSSFDEFLEEKVLLQEVEFLAIKRIIALLESKLASS